MDIRPFPYKENSPFMSMNSEPLAGAPVALPVTSRRLEPLLRALGYQLTSHASGSTELVHPQLGRHVCKSPELYDEYVAGLAAGRALNTLEYGE